MTLQKLFSAILLAGAVFKIVPLQAAPVFWVTGLGPDSAGTLDIWAQSDIRLSGVSLDLIEVGGTIKFTGATVHNPNNRWAFIATPTISDSVVARIDGGAIPNVVGGGIGPGSPDPGPSVLFATVDYMATGRQGDDQFLFLRVGGNVIADWVGNSPPVAFGDGPANVPGGVPGGFGPVGTCNLVQACDISAVIPVVADADLGNRLRGEIITHTFQTSSGAPPITWSDLSVMGPGGAAPAHMPTLAADGSFTWNSANSSFGTWTFSATAANNLTGDVGTLTLNLIIPEPTTIALAALALATLASLRRRPEKSS
ncbi:MAG TPA: PEP-CTERM sorting domain-containing protein [Lacipirellulaceae bacterium]